MRNLRPVVLAILAVGFLVPHSALAQTTSHANKDDVVTPPDNTRLSLELGGGYAMGVSSSMRGTNAEFQSDLMATYNNRRYPFGDPNAFGASGIARLTYRFRPSAFGVYLAGSLNAFITTDNSQNQQASLGIATVSLGGEYFQPISNKFDAFGRAGINGSLIGGQVDYNQIVSGTVTIPDVTRFGLEAGAGVNWKAASFLVVSLAADYFNVNLIGKSYTNPGASPNQYLFRRQLNDGANPNDPNDKSRTIDFLTIALTVGLRV